MRGRARLEALNKRLNAHISPSIITRTASCNAIFERALAALRNWDEMFHGHFVWLVLRAHKGHGRPAIEAMLIGSAPEVAPKRLLF